MTTSRDNLRGSLTDLRNRIEALRKSAAEKLDPMALEQRDKNTIALHFHLQRWAQHDLARRQHDIISRNSLNEDERDKHHDRSINHHNAAKAHLRRAKGYYETKDFHGSEYPLQALMQDHVRQNRELPKVARYQEHAIDTTVDRHDLGPSANAPETPEGSKPSESPKSSESSESLNKSQGRITFPGLPGITTRPDQEVHLVQTNRQAEMVARNFVNKMGHGQSKTGVPKLDAARQVQDTANQSMIRRAITPDQMHANKLYGATIGGKDVDGKKISVALHTGGRPDTSDLKDLHGNAVGGSSDFQAGKEHEGFHHIMDLVDRKYGPEARRKIVDHLHSHIDPAHLDHINANLRHRGYSPGLNEQDRSIFKEEAINHIHDAVHTDYARNMLPKELHPHLKPTWRKMREAAAKITPEFFAEQVEKSKNARAKLLASAGSKEQLNQLLNQFFHTKTALHAHPDGHHEVHNSNGTIEGISVREHKGRWRAEHEPLDKSKNVRAKKKELFGDWHTTPDSEQRKKQMDHISRYAEKRYNAPVERAPGKKNKQGKLIDKPDLTGGQIQHIGNPDSLIHELAHLDTAPAGQSMKDFQVEMDDLWGKQNVQYGFKQQARLAPEYEATAREQQIRRGLGLPAHRKERTIVDPKQATAADRPNTKVVQDWPNKKVKTKDSKGKPAIGTRKLAAGAKILSPESKRTFLVRDSAESKFHPDTGWKDSSSPDTLINLRQVGEGDHARVLSMQRYRDRLKKARAIITKK